MRQRVASIPGWLLGCIVVTTVGAATALGWHGTISGDAIAGLFAGILGGIFGATGYVNGFDASAGVHSAAIETAAQVVEDAKPAQVDE